MDYHILADSCCELTKEMEEADFVERIPLTIHIEEEVIVDDETFHQKDFLRKVAQSEHCPKSACPSPESYMQGMKTDKERIYVVTLSAELSGSYNSAVLGKNLYTEENETHKGKKIHIFNSKSASVGETLIVEKIMESEAMGLSFDEVVERVENYIEGQHTYFVLENLDTLRKNGRLTGIKAFVASALNIKPVMGADSQGNIFQIGQARGIRKALKKMVDAIEADVVDGEKKTIGITHCNCEDRALQMKKELEERIHPASIVVLDTRGISSLYAGDGGVIIVV